MKSLMVFCLFIMALVMAQFAHAQTVDEVVDKYVAAIGGKEKLQALKSVKMEGSLSVQGLDIGITITVSQGVGSRTDIAVPGAGDGFQIMTPTKGWSFMPFQGQASPEEVSPEQVKAGQASLDIQGSLFNYKEKGSTVELLGKEQAEGAECYKLKITNKAGKVSTLFLNTTTYYRVKSVTTVNINGEESEMETTYTDFKKTPEGYVFAYSQTNARGTIIFSNIEVNKPVDESIFTVK